MYITGIYEILNVWSNDANKVTLFIGLMALPFLLYLILRFNKIINIKALIYKNKISGEFFSLIIRVSFILVVVSFVTSLSGIGQIILFPVLDALIRSLGIVIFIAGLILIFIMKKLWVKFIESGKTNIREMFFNNEVRYPEYLFIFMITFGASVMTLNLAGIILTILVLLPSIILKIKKEEKVLIDAESSYYNYSIDVPMIFPDIKDIIKRLFLKKFNA